MKLKDYINTLTKMTEKDPLLLECEVVYEDHENKTKKLDAEPIIGYHSGTHFYALSPVPFVEKRPNNAVKLI